MCSPAFVVEIRTKALGRLSKWPLQATACGYVCRLDQKKKKQ